MDPVVTSLLSGLVGAVIGAALVLVGQWLERGRRESGAGRAVHMEMVTNLTLLEALASNGEAWGPISNSVYLNELSTIAPALSPAQFRAVAAPYVFVAHAEHLRRAFLDGRPLQAEDRTVLLSTAEDFRGGADVLRKKWWPEYGR